MNTIKKYDVLITLAFLFVFLGLLSLRMSWKINYNFDNKLIYICDNVIDIYNNYTSGNMDNSSCKKFLNNELDKANELANDNINSRADYIYSIMQVQTDINTMITDEENGYNAYYDVCNLIIEHNVTFTFGIIFLSIGIIAIIGKVVLIIIKKRNA